MKFTTLEELLTPVGIRLVAECANALAGGARRDAHYLDVHAALREVIRPHVKNPDEDVDYLTLVILNALREKGVPVPGVPPGIL